jgi:hypothetical protein
VRIVAAASSETTNMAGSMVPQAAAGKPILGLAGEYRPANCTRRDMWRLSRVEASFRGNINGTGLM